jgi:hypothetical protein
MYSVTGEKKSFVLSFVERKSRLLVDARLDG